MFYESETFYNCSLHHIFQSELQKIVGNLLDELRKLYINETVIEKFLAVVK